MNDHPFYEVARQAERKMQDGFTVYQKFTCEGCGARQTIGEANRFFLTGTCEECGALTNIAARGCNFMATIGDLALW